MKNNLSLKLTFEDALEDLSDGCFVKRGNVLASALNRKVWVAEWHLPGCLSESQCYSTTKAEAIYSALVMAEGDNGPPRGMKTALMRYGTFETQSPLFGRVINTVSRTTLADLL